MTRKIEQKEKEKEYGFCFIESGI